MPTNDDLGGVIHTYQKFDPVEFPSPTAPPPDMVTPAFEHLLQYGNTRRLTEEELARAVRIDPSQIRGLGPSLEYLRAMLEERKRKILETYETGQVQAEAHSNFHEPAEQTKPPAKLTRPFQEAVREEQLHDLEQLWYRSGDEHGPFARQLMQLIERLGEKYQVDELAAKYEFTGRTPMAVPEALEVKKELEAIDKLLKQLEEAAKTAQIGVIDLEELAQFAEPGDIEQLAAAAAADPGIPEADGASSRALEEAQARLPDDAEGLPAVPVEAADAHLRADSGVALRPAPGADRRRRRHRDAEDEPYEFGDSVTHMDIPASFVNALLRSGPACRCG